jgi:hypothetical protein
MLFPYSVRVELFPPPPKMPLCGFKQWIYDYMTSSDESYVALLKKIVAMKKSVSSSK